MDPVPVWKQRRFILVMIDLVIGLVMYFGGKYLSPSTFDDIKVVFGLMQPVILTLVIAYTVDNAQLNKAGLVRTRQGVVPIGKPKA